MAEAIINSLMVSNKQSSNKISVYDINEERRGYLQAQYGVHTCSTADEAVKDADIVILAVKPQNVVASARSLSSPPSGVILSIVAGCTIETLAQHFKTELLIRSMPNTPAMVLEGITVWTATKKVPEELLDKARNLLGSIGEQVEVTDESYLDMATAVSGSGPAYVFLTMEAMIDAAVHLGFPRDTAVKLVTATIRGSASYAMQSPESISALRNNVTSPGGTTASALYELERGGFRTVIADGIWSAYRKALELGGNDSNVGPGRSRTTTRGT
jgi:pyrroline-5-carboxylate reductase